MAQQFSRRDERRITFLSLLSSAATAFGSDEPFEVANQWLADMEEAGFFEEAASAARPTQQRSERSARPASSSRPSNRGRDQARTPFTGQMRDPDGPPSEKQVNLLLQLTDDYTEDEVWEMSKKAVSDLISDLK